MVSLACAVVLSTRAMTRTIPLVLGSEKTARAIPPRVVVWEGASVALPAHSGSSSNVTSTPSTARRWASCARPVRLYLKRHRHPINRSPLGVLHPHDHLGDLRKLCRES